jgi:hypothetical protein
MAGNTGSTTAGQFLLPPEAANCLDPFPRFGVHGFGVFLGGLRLRFWWRCGVAGRPEAELPEAVAGDGVHFSPP